MTHSPVSLNPIDRRILEILQKDGRVPNVQLAAAVGLSPSAVLERVRKLEERGIIDRYVTLLDHKKLGLGTVAFVAVSLNLHQRDSIDNFHKFVQDSEKVLECYHVAGGEDYLLKVYARDIEDYEHFLLSSLTRTKGIDKVKTMFVLSILKRETAMPLVQVEMRDGKCRKVGSRATSPAASRSPGRMRSRRE